MELILAIGIGILFATGIFQLLRRNIIRSAIGLVILMNAAKICFCWVRVRMSAVNPLISARSPASAAMHCPRH